MALEPVADRPRRPRVARSLSSCFPRRLEVAAVEQDRRGHAKSDGNRARDDDVLRARVLRWRQRHVVSPAPARRSRAARLRRDGCRSSRRGRAIWSEGQKIDRSPTKKWGDPTTHRACPERQSSLTAATSARASRRSTPNSDAMSSRTVRRDVEAVLEERVANRQAHGLAGGVVDAHRRRPPARTPGSRCCGKVRVEPGEQVGRDLRTQGLDLASDELGGERSPVDPLERPGADPERERRRCARRVPRPGGAIPRA